MTYRYQAGRHLLYGREKRRYFGHNNKLRIFEKTIDGKLASHTAQKLDLVQDRKTGGSFYSPGSISLFSHKCHIHHTKCKNSM